VREKAVRLHQGVGGRGAGGRQTENLPVAAAFAQIFGKIEQVLYNLIDNAIKFSSQNSSIIIQTSLKKEKIFISVKDTGIGIAKNEQSKVFDRFYKSDLSRGKDKKGTGLGLSIVKEILQAHGENIDVISTVGIGTEFIFSLPISKEI